jgi:hypothetical protein
MLSLLMTGVEFSGSTLLFIVFNARTRPCVMNFKCHIEQITVSDESMPH